LGEARGDELFGRLRRAISRRPGPVENRGSTLGDLLKHDGILTKIARHHRLGLHLPFCGPELIRRGGIAPAAELHGSD
jgi:hypothetical protein